ncbi:MAG TPA: AAA family ATPase [Usitatibacter sp.]|nr:AAA family ATPase [Usitatibacter sp.]
MSRQGLLEREEPLRSLQAARGRAETGGCVALVSGEAGIGKTSLVAAFTDTIGDRSFVACGRCDALFTPRVLGPAHDIAERHGGALKRALDSNAGRPAVFAAFLDMLRAPNNPVIVFEDVHWADEATLDLIKYLGRRIGETRAFLVLTYRDDELSARHPLRLVIGDLPRQHMVRVELRPLSLGAVEQMASASGAHAQGVHEATGGNPFFVTEILASGGGISASVRDAVLARAARLGPRAREVADLTSVSPGGLEIGIIQQCVAGADDGIVECESLGVMGTAGRVLRFRHEIARLAILDALGEQGKRLLNARVLEALRAKDHPELARLAHHAEAADERAAALEYSTAAAERAAILGGHREAAQHYTIALRHADDLPETEKGELLEAAAWEYQMTGRAEEGLKARDAAIAIWHRRGDVEREAACLGRMSGLLIAVGRNPEADMAMRTARSMLEGIPVGPTHALVYRYHTYLRMLERDVAEAIADGEKALVLARRHGDLESEMNVLNSLGSSLLVADDERGYEHLEASVALARAHGRDYHLANAYGNLGSASGEVHRYRRALGYLDAGIEFCAQHDLDGSHQYQLAWRSLAHLHLGHWAQAAEDAAAVLALPAATAISRIMALIAMGRLRARRGDPGAWQALDEALALSAATQTLQRLAPVRAARAEAAWLEGEDSAAAREAAAADGLARAKRHGWFVAELAYWQWKGGKAVDVPEYASKAFAWQAQGRWKDAAEDWRERGCPYETAQALAEGDTNAKLEAVRIFDELGARPAAERVRKSLRAAGVRRIPRGPRASTKAQPAGLTRREVQILGLIAEGLTNAEVATRIHISPKTVEHHVSAILAKLGVASRREAIRAAQNREVSPM